MVLSDRDIKKYLEEGKIKIEPFPDLKTQLGSCSIDLRLGDTFLIFEHSKYAHIDLRKNVDISEIMHKVTVPSGEAFVMQPGEFVLATTIESIEIPDDLLGRIDGRSSLGRLGIVIHSTSSVFDPGWRGHATLELSNIGRMPVALYPGMRICSFTFEQLTSPCEVPYYKKPSSKYVGQRDPEPSKLSSELK